MKKFLSFLLAVMMLFSLCFTAVAEETTFKVVYTLPTNMHTAKTSDKWIAVNQGTIKVVFSQNVKSGYEGITFKDPEGNDPKGGVYYEVDGTTVTLKFGELPFNTTYTLSVPATVESETGEFSSAYTDTFVTINRKILVDADFSDTTIWKPKTLTPTDKGLFKDIGYSEDDAYSLYQKLNSYSASNNALSITEN